MDRQKQIYKVTLAGGAVNVILLVFKFVAGILGHSAAMIADAIHSLSDFITDLIVLVFVYIRWQRSTGSLHLTCWQTMRLAERRQSDTIPK